MLQRNTLFPVNGLFRILTPSIIFFCPKSYKAKDMSGVLQNEQRPHEQPLSVNLIENQF